MKTILVFSAILMLSNYSFAEDCKAPSLGEFVQQMDAQASEFGWYSSLDYTKNALCFAQKATCEQKVFSDQGGPGYYTSHFVYAVFQNGKVVFAETSAYEDMTYGASRG